MTLWESIIIVTLFSIAVIVMDEIIHARRRKRREREGAARVGHCPPAGPSSARPLRGLRSNSSAAPAALPQTPVAARVARGSPGS